MSDDKIEQEGIRRAIKKAQDADIKIFVVDATNPIFNHELIDLNSIIIINKIDKIKNFDFDFFIKENRLDFDVKKILPISLINKINTSQLIKILEEQILEILPQNNSPLITQERYRKILQDCLINLKNFSLDKNIEIAAQDLWITSRELGKITGKFDIENILEIIFSRFCIGK